MSFVAVVLAGYVRSRHGNRRTCGVPRPAKAGSLTAVSFAREGS